MRRARPVLATRQDSGSGRDVPECGEEGVTWLDPDHPQRKRTNSRCSRASYRSDRPPIVGLVGRERGRGPLTMVETANRRELLEAVRQATAPGTTVATDDWTGHQPIRFSGGRPHRTWIIPSRTTHGPWFWTRRHPRTALHTEERLWTAAELPAWRQHMASARLRCLV
jgi:hypothetical protein